MAVQVVCAVYDEASQSFSRPIFVPARGIALRSFIDEVNRDDPNNSMFVHTKDYKLYCIGEFDDVTGRLTSLDLPEVLMSGDTAKQVK